MYDLENAVVPYGPIKMAEELHKFNILNSTDYDVMTALIHLEHSDQASILIDLVSDNIRDVLKYEKFKDFLRSKPTLDHLFYQLVTIGKLWQLLEYYYKYVLLRRLLQVRSASYLFNMV